MLIERTAHRALTTTTLLSLMALSSTAVAQQANDGLDQVIVTASKIEKPINEVTHSVTVVSEEQIKEQGFTDVTEILRQQAGIEFKQVGGPGQFNYLKLRGLGSENVLVVVDGVTINTASGGNTRNLLSQLNPDVIESIEIVRGPQATLYGANATAGVIVIKTKSGKKTEASISAEAGSLAWRKYDGSLRDNVSLGNGLLLYSANLSKTDSGGIHQYEYFKDKSAQLKLDYETSGWTIGGSYWKSSNDFGYAQLYEANCCQTKDTYWSFQTPDPDSHSETDETIGSVHFDWNFTDSLKQQIKVGHSSTDYTIADAANGLLGYQWASITLPASATGGSSSAPAIPAGSPIPVYDTPGSVLAFYTDYRNQASYELLFNSQHFNLMGGLEHQEQGAKQWGTYGVSSTDDSQSSVYANGDLKLLDMNLIVSLGARLDDYESWGKQTTGNFGFAWQIASPINVYANYGTSFKPATMSQLFNPVYGDSTLKPESGRTVELGVRSHLIENRLNLEAAYWNTHLDDVIFFDYSIVNSRRTSGFGQYNNGSEGKTSGVEFKTSYELSDAIGVYGNYTYTDSQTRAVGALWKRSVQIAYNKANVGVNYKMDRLTLGANMYYSGPRLRWAADLETAGYMRLDVTARYKLTQRLSLSARIENLLDRDYLDELGYAETGMYSVFGIDYKFF